MKSLLILFLLLFCAQVFAQTTHEQHSEQVLSLLKKGADIYQTDFNGAKKFTAEALSIAMKSEDDYLLARCHKALAFYERQLRNQTLLRYDSLFLHHAEAARNDTLTLDACNLYAQDLLNQGQYAKAVPLLDKGTALAERTGNKNYLARLYLTRGFYHEQQNNPAVAVSCFNKSLQLFTALNNGVMTAYAKQRLATVSVAGGRPTDEALNQLTEALYYYQKNNKPVEEATCYDVMGTAYMLLGNNTRALPYFWQSRALFKTAGYTIKVVDEDLTLASLYLNQKNADSAGHYLAEAETLSASVGYAKGTAITASLKIQLLTLQKKFEEAERAAAEAKGLTSKLGRRELEMMTNEFLGSLKDAKGDKDSAAHYLLKRLEILKKTYSPAELSKLVDMDLRRAGIRDQKSIEAAKRLLGVSDSAHTAIKEGLSDSLRTALLKTIGTLPPGSDSSLQAVLQKQLVEMETKYANRLYRDSITVQNQKIQLAQNRLHEGNLWLLAAVLALAVLLLLGFYLYRSRRQAQRLRKAEEGLRLAEEEKRKTVEQLKLYAEHQVDNILAIIQSIVSETKMASTDETSFMKLEGRIEPLFLLYNMLKETPSGEIPMHAYLEKICRSLGQSYGGGRQISVEVDAPQTLNGKKAGTLGLIVNELVTNSFKYAFRQQNTGSIAVRLRNDGERNTLHVSDSGTGLAGKTRTGLGTGLINELAYALRAEVRQYDNCGANFEIIFL